MSVKTEIERLAANIAGAYAACGEKGAELPASQTSDFLPEAIRSIQGGGGGDFAVPLVVTVEAGAVVTAVKGEVSVSATAGEDGTVALVLPEPGEYTVFATKGDKRSTKQNVTATGLELGLTMAAGVLTYYGTGEALSARAEDPAGLTIGGHALIAGGMSSNSTFSSKVFAYDAELVRTDAPTLGSARSAMGAACVGEYGLFAGGKYNYSSSVNPTTSVNAYNEKLVRSAPTALSAGRRGLCGITGVNRAYFAGGYTSGSGTAGSNVVDAYDGKLTRTVLENMSATRYSPAGTSVGRHSLITGTGTIVDVYDDAQTHTVLEARLSAGRAGISATTTGGFALFAGGSGSNITVDVFDKNLTHTVLETGLSVSRYLFTSCTLLMLAIFAGGNTGEGGAAVDVFDENLTHVVGPELSVARGRLAGAAIGKYAIFAGGAGYSTAVDFFTIE